ncbi:MAG: hypothetical protein D8M59_12835 [Planctomycetes bacterium]|nr:hypothetical protein [Planctomycetota bacterium]
MKPSQVIKKTQETYPNVRGFAVFPVYAPHEIIHAAGLMPVGLYGAGDQLEITHADSRFQSFICSIAKSTLELFLADEMDGFVGIAFSSICDVARNLASVVSRNTEGIYVEYLHLPQNMASEQSQTYTRSEYERFRRKLAEHVGRPITDAAISESLKLYNEQRRLIRAIYAYRQDHPGSISAAELTCITKAGTRMMPGDYLTILKDVMEQLPQRPAHARDTVRVVVEGAFCEQPPIELIEAIEAAGCEIRDDDMMLGWRLFTGDVSEQGDPLTALANAYLNESVYCSTRHDYYHPRTEGLLARVRDSGAKAVLFTPAKFCEPALLDYVLFKRCLDDKGVPHLKLEFEEKMWTFEAPRTEVETFAESMLFD